MSDTSVYMCPTCHAVSGAESLTLTCEHSRAIELNFDEQQALQSAYVGIDTRDEYGRRDDLERLAEYGLVKRSMRQSGRHPIYEWKATEAGNDVMGLIWELRRGDS